MFISVFRFPTESLSRPDRGRSHSRWHVSGSDSSTAFQVDSLTVCPRLTASQPVQRTPTYSGEEVYVPFPLLPFGSKRLARLWIDRFLSRKHLQGKAPRDPHAPIPPRQLIDKHMRDSYTEDYIPFKSDPQVREEYVNPYGNIRSVFNDDLVSHFHVIV